jgi:hypothetical protein
MRGQAIPALVLGISGVLGASALLARGERDAAPAALPAGWRELPELALAAPAAAGPVRVESRRGYGDPASGCFALVQRASGEGAQASAARAALVAGLKKRGFEVSGGTSGEELAVRGPGMAGRIRTAIHVQAGGRFAAVSTACFHNDRQPDRCEAECAALLDRLGGGR